MTKERLESQKRQTRCAVCGQKHDPVYLWQPSGPADNVVCFPFRGWHYRGFTSLDVCEPCKAKIESGKPVEFCHKGRKFSVNDFQLTRVNT